MTDLLQPANRRSWPGLRWLAGTKPEWALALALTALAGWFHWSFFTHAGGLWRDEAGLPHIATLPTWGERWAMLTRDHSPILATALLRGWCALGWGGSDGGLRAAGLAIGLLLIAAYWVAGWSIRRGAPLLALALVATNVVMLRSTDALRAYGLGAVTAVLVFATMWRVARRPTWANAALAALAAVASVQALFQNAFFVLAAAGGGMLVCARRGDWRAVAKVAGAGAVAAASLIPYVSPILAAQHWYSVEQEGFRLARAWDNLVIAAGFPGRGFVWIWVGLTAAALAAAAVACLARRCPAAAGDGDDAVVYGGVALAVGIGGFAVFLTIADLPTQFWYYVPLLTFVAAGLDAVLPRCHRWARWILMTGAAGVALAAGILGGPILRVRQTNIDQVAAQLNRLAVAGDFILVHPWYCGVSFARYYRGAAEWDTLPPLADHGLHRYDLVKAQMQRPNPIQPVLDRMAAALASGHHVWLVGWMPMRSEAPPALPPAPGGPYGWQDEPYSASWGARAGQLLVTRARRGEVVVRQPGEDVNPAEQMPLVVFSGWR